MKYRKGRAGRRSTWTAREVSACGALAGAVALLCPSPAWANASDDAASLALGFISTLSTSWSAIVISLLVVAVLGMVLLAIRALFH